MLCTSACIRDLSPTYVDAHSRGKTENWKRCGEFQKSPGVHSQCSETGGLNNLLVPILSRIMLQAWLFNLPQPILSGIMRSGYHLWPILNRNFEAKLITAFLGRHFASPLASICWLSIFPAAWKYIARICVCAPCTSCTHTRQSNTNREMMNVICEICVQIFT